MIQLLFFPIILTTFLLFLAQGLFHQNSPIILLLTIIVSLLASIGYLKSSVSKLGLKTSSLKVKRFLLNSGLPILIILFFLAAICLVLSPLIITQTVNNFQFIRFPGVWDYYKHSYVITGINSGGVPPLHPYLPSSQLSYYYGYYLIPAAIIKISGFTQTTVLFFYVLLTDALALLLLNWLIRQTIKKSFNRTLALLLAIFGTGMDAIPILIHRVSVNHLENWFGNHDTGLIVYNIFTAFLWAPQHILPAVLSLYLLFCLIKRKLSLPLFVLIYSYIFLSSTFVAITLTFWLGLLFLFVPTKRFPIFVGGLLTVIFNIPYFLELSSHNNILSVYSFAPYPFIAGLPDFVNTFSNFFLTLLVEYGFLLFVFPVLGLTLVRSKKKILWFFLSSYLLIVITWVLRSGGPNDFGMKTMLPVQILLAIVFVYFIEITPTKRSRLVLSLFTLLIICPGVLGFFYEYSLQWRRRFVLDPQTTQLVKAVRKLPQTAVLGVIERGEWAFDIPVLGFRPIYSPSLYDAGVYVNNSTKDISYEEMGSNIFISSTTADNLPTLIEKRNLYFKDMRKYFTLHPFDKLIVSNKTYVKQGENIWRQLFNQMNVSSSSITPDFTAYDYSSLVASLNTNALILEEKQMRQIKGKDQKLSLPAGFWFLATCSDNNKTLKLDFEDYFTVFNLNASGCIGNLFYHPDANDIRLSNQSTVTDIFAFPVIILNNQSTQS